MTSSSVDYCVLGGGIAGLTIAREIARAGRSVTVIERDTTVGGLARTIRKDGYAFDLGGHRFHSNNPDVVNWLRELLGTELLTVKRFSRIHIQGRFVDYPIRLSQAALAFGPVKAATMAGSYAAALVRPRNGEDVTFEDWIIRRFGRALYDIYFRPYTEKVWGIPCHELSADWASQRISLPNLTQAVYQAIVPSKTPPATSIPHFYYPRMGYGTIGNRLAEEIVALGGRVDCASPVTNIAAGPHGAVVSTRASDGTPRTIDCGRVISTVPVDALLAALSHDADVAQVAREAALPYRGLILVLLAINRPQASPDSWTYFPSSSLLFGRTHEPKNWSAAMVPGPHVTSLAVEIFSTPGDGTWEQTDQALTARTVAELTEVGWLRPEEVAGSWVIKVPYAYPIYTLDYRARVARVRSVLAKWPWLSLVGRTGAFSYRNVDGIVEDCFQLMGDLGLRGGAAVAPLAGESGRWI